MKKHTKHFPFLAIQRQRFSLDYQNRSSADGHHIDVDINLDATPPQAHITDETGATLWSSTS